MILAPARVAEVARDNTPLRGEELVIFIAIGMGESEARGHPHHCDSNAHNVNPRTGDDSWGIWQANMTGALGPWRRERYGLKSNTDLFVPATNARVAYGIYSTEGTARFRHWGAFRNGSYKRHLEAARAAVAAISRQEPESRQMPGDSPLVSSFVQAKHYTKGPRTKGPVTLVVVHSMEAPEKGETAENVAAYFKRGERVASAHFNVDSNSIVQSVRERDIAYHAKSVNHNGIGIEHAGYARQTRNEWLDAYSTAMLRLSAKLTAELCKRYGLPVCFVDASGLKRGEKGVTTHVQASKAFNPGGHHDPGAGFPMDLYLKWVNQALRPRRFDVFYIHEGTGYHVVGSKSEPLARGKAGSAQKKALETAGIEFVTGASAAELHKLFPVS